MKRIWLTAAIAGLASATIAEELPLPPQLPPPEVIVERQELSQQQQNKFLVRAPIADPGENVELSDILTISRGFDAWTLGCSVRISSGRRSCSIEQVIVDAAAEPAARSSLKWGIGTSLTNQALLYILVTSNFEAGSGMRLAFAGFEKTIPQQEWFCSENGCVASVPYEGLLQTAIQSTAEIGFSYKIKIKKLNDEMASVDMTGQMAGFQTALKIAATNPFAPVETSKPKAAEIKPEATPVKAEAAPTQPKKSPQKVRQEAKSGLSKNKNSDLY